MREFRATGTWTHELAARFGGAPLPFEWDLLEEASLTSEGVVLPGSLGWRQMGRARFQPPQALLPPRGEVTIRRSGQARATLGPSTANLGQFREVVLTVNRVEGEWFSSWLLLPEVSGLLSLEIRLASGSEDWEELREEGLRPALLVAEVLRTELREMRQET